MQELHENLLNLSYSGVTDFQFDLAKQTLCMTLKVREGGLLYRYVTVKIEKISAHLFYKIQPRLTSHKGELITLCYIPARSKKSFKSHFQGLYGNCRIVFNLYIGMSDREVYLRANHLYLEKQMFMLK